MDADLRDSVRFGESNMLPALARVTASIHTVTGENVAADTSLTGTNENQVRG